MRLVLIPVIAGVLAFSASALAADVAAHPRPYSAHARRSIQGHYPLSRRAADVRRADVCWRGCEARSARVFRSCLRTRTLTACVPENDSADLRCQHECRISGGPWVELVQ